MANETPSRPPPFMANAILNFHFDFLHTSLIFTAFSGPYSPLENGKLPLGVRRPHSLCNLLGVITSVCKMNINHHANFLARDGVMRLV